MRPSLLPLLLAAILASCNTPEEKESIQVIGQARLTVIPDMVELSLKAHHVRPALRDAVAETQGAVQQIMAICRQYVSDSADIKVSNISTNKSFAYVNGQERFAGFEAQQVLAVTLRDIRQLERFAEALLATPISQIDNIRYDHTQADSIQREVHLMALEDARRTAEKMCQKMNVQLGDITYLSNYRAAGRSSSNSGSREADYEMNLYNKGFGGRGFKMTAEILQFEDRAFAGFRFQ